ncbi:ubiquitin conjugating enzyme E2 U (putative), transcript variant X1 [Ictidomys tridecemlineatus]|nr:ubiquitin conjugating enzyme E2 U (putative), transcript variant X1 [Ictidomys tridecemlineatus]
MYSRAYILLERDLKELNQNNFVGITAFPITDDMLKWQAEIEGLQNSSLHGFVLQLTIEFTSEYNLAPPVVKFTTIPFHPNVDPYTGQPCIDFLDNPKMWNTGYTLSSILLALQVMLSYPVLENPVNMQAAQMLIKDEYMYRKIIRKLFQEPLQLKDDDMQSSQDQDKLVRSIKSISFNDYYKTWSRIATSKATESYRAPLLGDPHFIGEYYKWKKIDKGHPKEWKLNALTVSWIFLQMLFFLSRCRKECNPESNQQIVFIFFRKIVRESNESCSFECSHLYTYKIVLCSTVNDCLCKNRKICISHLSFGSHQVF